MPLALAGLGLAAVGTGMSIAGNAQSQSAMNKVRANTTAQQAAIQRNSNQIFQGSLGQSTPQTAANEMQAGQDARTGIWSNLQNATTPVASALPPSTAGSPTSKASARTSAAADSWNKLNATAAAKEGSYGDWENQQNIKNANAAQDLSIQNNFAQGNAALEPVEMQVASQAGDKLSGWGSIVSSLGALAGVAGATGAFGTGTGTAAGINSAYQYPGTAAMLNNAGAAETVNNIAGPLPTNVWANLYR